MTLLDKSMTAWWFSHWKWQAARLLQQFKPNFCASSDTTVMPSVLLESSPDCGTPIAGIFVSVIFCLNSFYLGLSTCIQTGTDESCQGISPPWKVPRPGSILALLSLVLFLDTICILALHSGDMSSERRSRFWCSELCSHPLFFCYIFLPKVQWRQGCIFLAAKYSDNYPAELSDTTFWGVDTDTETFS